MEVEFKVKVFRDESKEMRAMANLSTLDEIIRILRDKSEDECTKLDLIADAIRLHLGLDVNAK